MLSDPSTWLSGTAALTLMLDTIFLNKFSLMVNKVFACMLFIGVATGEGRQF